MYRKSAYFAKADLRYRAMAGPSLGPKSWRCQIIKIFVASCFDTSHLRFGHANSPGSADHLG
jgi:hypothetical protein